MNINWFPGHMHKATKEIRKLLPGIDIIIEVLDARLPYSSQNPVIAQFSREKANIKLLNKSDLADPETTAQWITHFNSIDNTRALAVSIHEPDSIHQLLSLCRKLAADKKDSPQGIHALITGIPNVGKSSIINLLAGRMIAKTGNEPAVTKAQQRIKIADDLTLHDSPGILWSRFDNQNSAYRLAASGAIKDTAISHDDIAFFTADYLLNNYPQALMTRYKLDSLPETELEFLETIGRQRGCLGGGGLVDLDKIGRLLINELRGGILGRISMETPAMAIQEQKDTEILLAKKAEEKAAKKAQRKKQFKHR